MYPGSSSSSLLHVARAWKKTTSSVSLSAGRVTGSDTGVCRGQSNLLCTHVARASKKSPCLKGNLMNFLKMLVLTLNSS